jgi:hypothetical protein
MTTPMREIDIGHCLRAWARQERALHHLCRSAVGPDHGAYRYAAVIALGQHRGNRPASPSKQRPPGTSGHSGSARGKALLARAHGDKIGCREFADRYRKMVTDLGFEGRMAWAEAMP